MSNKSVGRAITLGNLDHYGNDLAAALICMRKTDLRQSSVLAKNQLIKALRSRRFWGSPNDVGSTHHPAFRSPCFNTHLEHIYI